MPVSSQDIDPILAAAAELFEKQGYDATTVDAIAARAGFARSTVFARYATKEALLTGIVRTFFEQFPRCVAREEARRPPAARERSCSRRAKPSRPAAGIPGDGSASVLLAALRGLCLRAGPIVRVALAAKDLPWVRAGLLRRARASSAPAPPTIPPLSDDPLVAALAGDVLKHATIEDDGDGTGREAAIGTLLALLALWAPAIRRGLPAAGRRGG